MLILLSLVALCGLSSNLRAENAQPASNEWRYPTQLLVTGQVTLATDYVFRGVSQSDEKPAVQGGIDISLQTGIYSGVLLTSVEKPWGTAYSRSGGNEDVEYDVFAGLQRTLARLHQHDLYIDLGLIHYGFESDPDDLSWSEAYLGGGWNGLSLRYSTRVAGALMGDYVEAAYEGELADGFRFRLHAGRYFLDRTVRNLNKYSDASISIIRDYSGFEFGLGWYRNDRDAERRFLDPAYSRLVFSVGRVFAPSGR